MNFFSLYPTRRELKVIDVDGGHKSKKIISDTKTRSEIICSGENADSVPEQTTLVSMMKSNFRSFPLLRNVRASLPLFPIEKR